MPRAPRKFILPDLVSYCPYSQRLNQHAATVSRASESWLLAEADFSATRKEAFLGLRAGLLTAVCYPDAEADQLQVVSDFMSFLFTLDDWSDAFDADDNYGLAQCVMCALDDPVGFQTSKAAGKLAKRCVRICMCALGRQSRRSRAG